MTNVIKSSNKIKADNETGNSPTGNETVEIIGKESEGIENRGIEFVNKQLKKIKLLLGTSNEDVDINKLNQIAQRIKLCLTSPLVLAIPKEDANHFFTLADNALTVLKNEPDKKIIDIVQFALKTISERLLSLKQEPEVATTSYENILSTLSAQQAVTYIESQIAKHGLFVGIRLIEKVLENMSRERKVIIPHETTLQYSASLDTLRSTDATNYVTNLKNLQTLLNEVYTILKEKTQFNVTIFDATNTPIPEDQVYSLKGIELTEYIKDTLKQNFDKGIRLFKELSISADISDDIHTTIIRRQNNRTGLENSNDKDFLKAKLFEEIDKVCDTIYDVYGKEKLQLPLPTNVME